MNFKLDDEFRDRNRRHTPQERKNLERLIDKNKCTPGALTVAVIGAARLLCDGYTTLSICEEKGIPTTPPVEMPFANRTEVLEWIDDRQRARRNLSAEEMETRRSERIEQVADLRTEGMSVRAIAEEVGVPKSTVVDDLKEATVRGRTVEPKDGKVKGKDKGRAQPAKRKPKPPRKCDRCTRKGCNLPDCEQCLKLNKPKPKRASPGPHVGNVGQSYDQQIEKCHADLEECYDEMLLILDRRAQAMGKAKGYDECIKAAFDGRKSYKESQKQYKVWVSA